MGEQTTKADSGTLIYEAVEAAFDDNWTDAMVRDEVNRAIESIEAENAQP